MLLNTLFNSAHQPGLTCFVPYSVELYKVIQLVYVSIVRLMGLYATVISMTKKAGKVLKPVKNHSPKTCS